VVHVLQPEITDSFHRELAMSPEAAQAALTHLDPLHTLVTALEAFGLGKRFLTSRRAREDGTTHVYCLVLRLADAPSPMSGADMDLEAFAVPGHLKLVWNVSVEPEGDGVSVISVVFEAAATDSASRRVLLDGWPLLGPIAEDRARHILDGVADFDDDAIEDLCEAVAAS
jgi:hypothetical protein